MTTKTTLNSEELKIFKKIACENDYKILQALGFEFNGSSAVQQECPVHGGDNQTAFSYHFGKCCWSCFTHGCHHKYGNDIIGLVRGLKKISFSDAIDWIQSVIDSDDFADAIVSRNRQELADNKIISDARLSKLDQNHDFIKSRGFSPELCKFFEAGVSTNGKTYHHRLMIPIRNINGNLVGITGRSIFEKNNLGWYFPEKYTIDETYRKLYGKWRHYPKGFNKSIEIYNIHNAASEIKKTGFAVIVEGPFDCWRMHMYGVRNVVAVMGSSLSNRQADLLQSVGANKLGLMMDSDEAGIKAASRIKSLFNSRFSISKILTDNKDPDMLSREDFESQVLPQIQVLTK